MISSRLVFLILLSIVCSFVGVWLCVRVVFSGVVMLVSLMIWLLIGSDWLSLVIRVWVSIRVWDG